MRDATACGWEALEHELSSGPVEFWWRDDDVAECTPALADFLDLLGRSAVPVAFAVIPGLLSSATARLVCQSDISTVLQHGYIHANHSTELGDKCEMSDNYSLDQLREELIRGRQILIDAFGHKALPVVAPPWNRIGHVVRRCLPSIGLRVLSLFGARDVEFCEPGLAEINAHVDLIDWAAGGVYCGDTKALQQIVSHLRAKRLGLADPAEPTGILSHHGKLCPGARTFVMRLLTEIAAADQATWVRPQTLFGQYI